MNSLPETLFLNAAYTALQTEHRHFGIHSGRASRYLPQLAPIGGIAESTPDAMSDLRSLMSRDEWLWIFGVNFPRVAGLAYEQTMPCLQMFIPRDVAPAKPMPGIVDLSGIHGPEMVALTDIAFPGFFRPETWRMGRYFGVRSGSDLIAMAGERMRLPGYPEISGVCTHPEHRGRGYAEGLMWHLICAQRDQGLQPWLHVTATNTKPIDLYKRMGFLIAREIVITRVIAT